MCTASEIHNKDPRFISFLDVLQFVKDAIPIISIGLRPIQQAFNYLLYLIAESDIDRPRRPRVNPRVVKVSGSKFKRKSAIHKEEIRSFENDIQIIQIA